MRKLLELTGVTPLVMHNPRLADPYDPIAKEISALLRKRPRTEEDAAQVARLEFLGGLYYDNDVGIHLPAWSFVRCCENAAKITRRGTTLLRAVALVTDRAPVRYDGPKEPAALWANETFRWRTGVVVKRDRIQRMRPIFRQWALDVELELQTDVLDESAFLEIAALAGRVAGLGTSRKLGYGRFSVVAA